MSQSKDSTPYTIPASLDAYTESKQQRICAGTSRGRETCKCFSTSLLLTSYVGMPSAAAEVLCLRHVRVCMYVK